MSLKDSFYKILFYYYINASATNFDINNKAKIYTTGETSFPLPETNFSTAYETIPKTIPFAIEYVRGIIIIVKNAGRASV